MMVILSLYGCLMPLKLTWRPKRRNIKDPPPKPDFVPGWVYAEALAARRFYNENWEFWVWEESRRHNKPVPETEDACIRGLKKALLQAEVIYGSRVGKWYEEFLDMSDIFSKVRNWPEFIRKLDNPKDIK